MKNIKRFTALMMGIGMALSLTGCGKELENKVQALSDLPGKTIGVETGSTGDIYASDYESPKDGAEPSTIVRYPKGNDAIRDLKLGQLDCVILDRQPAEGYVNNNDDLKILTVPFAEEEYAIAISKDNTDLKEQINTALAELKDDGVIDDIISNYAGSANKGDHPYTSPEDVDRSKGTLTMATNPYFAPYEYYQNSVIIGIDVDLAQAICDKLGYELAIKETEFEDIPEAVSSGKVDMGIAAMSITEDRLKIIDFSDPYTTSSQVIIVRKD